MPFYAVTGIPPGSASPDTHGPAAGLSAFMPHLNRMAASGAQQYKFSSQVEGYPGTRRIDVYPQARVPSDMDSPATLALKGGASSTDAPEFFYPNIYWARPEREYYPGAGMPVQIYDPVRPQDTTMLPVPAVSYRAYWLRQQAMLSYGVEPGGQRQVIAWPRQLQRWRPRNSLAARSDQ